MLGEKFLRVKIRDGEYEVIGPLDSESFATATLRMRPRAHLKIDEKIEAELLIVTKKYELGKDGRLVTVATLADVSTDHE